MRYSTEESLRARRQERGAAPVALPIVLIVAVLSGSGCASSIMPIPGRRLSMVIDEGRLAYVKEGRKYSSGPFGGQIEEAVQGVPAAEEHARSFKTQLTIGYLVSVLGSVGAGVGLGVFVSEASHNSNGQGPPPDTAGLWVAAGGLVLESIGLFVLGDAARHQLDAINVYNDAVLEGPSPEPAHAAGPASAPPAATPESNGSSP
ncbi:MAG: hypothetical protein JOZ69_19605 [Myxococcales bacterium]|nr:hypothetical protein [Myxococcales bacterium]